ncbi:hypothetical protein AB0I53_43865 [Saccharopolyspora sp. NPDC050389]|uniref:hypothetical protein n=1 Tax=Saccharopolyspora sp. NPDC050389 TaxID=3155516 RepID=UPI0033FF24F5
MTGGRYELSQDGPQWILTVAIDEKWLQAPQRQYPVFVDPTMSFGGAARLPLGWG